MKRPVLVSVISAGEVLRIRDTGLRKLICSTMLALHGDGPLLDHPLNLASAAAQAVLRGDQGYQLPESSPAKHLRACLSDPTAPPAAHIQDWLRNLDQNMQAFLEEIKPGKRDSTTDLRFA